MEHYGVVWGWFGNPLAADPAHLPSLPFLPPNGGLPSHMTSTVRFDCSAPISLENLIDLTHADFLHADVVGDERSESETIATFYDSETITMLRTCVEIGRASCRERVCKYGSISVGAVSSKKKKKKKKQK